MVSTITRQADDINHNTVTLGKQLEEANRMVNEITSHAQSPLPPDPSPPKLDASPQVQDEHEVFSAQNLFSQRQSPSMARPQTPPAPRSPELNRLSDMSTTVADSPTTTSQKRISAFSLGGYSSRQSVSSISSEGRSIAESTAELYPYASSTRQPSTKTSKLSRVSGSRTRPDSEILSPALPSPAMELPPNCGIEQATASVKRMSIQRPEIIKLHRSSVTSQEEQFEKAAFRNSAIVCDV